MERSSLFQKGQLICVEGTHISLERKPLALERGASRKLFPARFE
jgi:hypothetical protein